MWDWVRASGGEEGFAFMLALVMGKLAWVRDSGGSYEQGCALKGLEEV